MAGTKAGGLKAAKMNKQLYGDDFYRKIGSKGGQQKPCKPRGFAANPALARIAGAKGGRASRRTGILNGQGKTNGEKNYVWKGDEDGFASQKD